MKASSSKRARSTASDGSGSEPEVKRARNDASAMAEQVHHHLRSMSLNVPRARAGSRPRSTVPLRGDAAPIVHLPLVVFGMITEQLVDTDLLSMTLLNHATARVFGPMLDRARAAFALLEAWSRPVEGMPPLEPIDDALRRPAMRHGMEQLRPERIDRAIDAVFGAITSGNWHRTCRDLAASVPALQDLVPDFMDRLFQRYDAAPDWARSRVLAALLEAFASMPEPDAVTRHLEPFLAQAAATATPSVWLEDVVSFTGVASAYRSLQVVLQPPALRAALGLLTSCLSRAAAASPRVPLDTHCLSLVRAIRRQMNASAFRGSAAEPVVLEALGSLYATRDAMDAEAVDQLGGNRHFRSNAGLLKSVMTPVELAGWQQHFPEV